MQVQCQVFGSRNQSLRKLITEDLVDRPHPVLFVEKFKSQERMPGWAKIKANGAPGAINIRWDAGSQMLTVRVVAKRGNSPHELLGAFLSWLVERHGKRIRSINVQLR